MKKRWVATDGWRGYYQPVPPDGWELLVDCSVVNESGIQARDIIAKWLRSHHIRYRSGYLETSNVFSANLYIVVEGGKLSDELRDRIDTWFVNTTTSTFSIFRGESWDLDVADAQRKFNAVVAQYN